MTTLTLGRLNLGALTRALLLACAAGVVGVMCGRVAISHYGVPAIDVLVAAPVLIFVLPRPFAACMLLLVLLASALFYTALPRANVPGHPPINIGDILLVATVGATMWRRPWRVWPPPVRRVYVVTALMLLLALIPMVILAVRGHSQFRDAIAGYKDLLYIAVALTVALELSERLWWPLVNAAIVLSVIVSILSLLAAASGSVGHLLTSVDAGAVTSVSRAVGGTSRIRLPGLFLVYGMTIPTLVLVLLVKDRWRSLRVAALLLMIGAIAVSLNRNMYFGGVAGLLVALLVGGGPLRFRFLISAVTIAAIVTLVVQSTVAPAVTAEISTRAQSALSAQVLSSNSAQARADEFSHALNSIAHHPWTGVGWFQNYGSYDGGTPRLGVEDWYLHLATDLGIPVALAFLLIPAVLLSYGLGRARRAAAPLDRALVAAGMGALVALLLSCLVGTYLQDPNSMTAFGFICGFLLAAALRATPKGEPSPSRDPDDHAQGRGATRCA
jgi:O-antigen ligase